MQDTDADFVALMERVRQGCPEAIHEMLNRYGRYIRQVIRQRLHQRMRPLFDSIDFQQDVWASFFDGANRYQFDSPEELIRFLCEMANNKVIEMFRHRMQTRKRDLNRERSLDRLHFEQIAPELTARHPSPSQVAMANEKWERLLERQPPHFRRILELRRQGHTHVEIAQQLRLDTKTVQRFLNSLQERGDRR